MSDWSSAVGPSDLQESAPAAQKTLEALYRRLEKTRNKGREPWALEIGDVDAAMAWVAADAGSGDVGGFAAGEALRESWKRPINPRPAPQQARKTAAEGTRGHGRVNLGGRSS